MGKIKTTKQILEEQYAQVEAARKNALTRPMSSTALTADNSNPWIEIATELDRFIGAPYVKFSKQGEYEISDSEVIPVGTRCIAHADEIQFGWRKWEDNRVTDERMGRVADRFVPPPRKELGDTDEDRWEMQDDRGGKRRDPWQFTTSMPVSRLDTGESYLFSTGSKGGLRCVNGISRTYGSRLRTKGEAAAGNPIIELQGDSYKHREYGKIFFPVMHIVGWTGPDGKPLSTRDDLNDDIPDFAA